MDKKALLAPRKVASQQRSRAMIEALVEATARALIKDGFERANTNRIAEEAGVSIGSLYQYFPGKEALVVAVIERHKSEMVDVLRGTLAKVATLPLDSAVRELVKTMIDAHRVNPDLHRVLVEETCRADRYDRRF
ncbi:TetR/AcrR family transcriptional regulator (plasmid) [Ensifer adhaerens]